MDNVKVINPGILTTIQDLGRYGYQRYGIPVAGVMDEYSTKIANYLVGNNENEAVLEITFLGPKLEFLEDMVIAVTGADLSPQINNKAVNMWESIQVRKGDKLSFKPPRKGMRAYLAFGGKINVPVVNGSKSTTMKSKLGGYKGRKLEKDDMLSIEVNPNALVNRKLDSKYIPSFNKEEKIRVIFGPQDDYFTENGKNTFLSSEYKVTDQADRMGIRLEGEKVEHKETADIISDGAVIGSIQIPKNGQPIILMADRQTTGGYTKIATVIKEDINKLSQMGTNSKIFFEKLSVEEGRAEYIKYIDKLKEIKAQIESDTCSSLYNEPCDFDIDKDNLGEVTEEELSVILTVVSSFSRIPMERLKLKSINLK